MFRICIVFMILGGALWAQTGPRRPQQFLRFHAMNVKWEQGTDRYAALSDGLFNWDEEGTVLETEDKETGFFLSDVVTIRPYLGIEVGFNYLGQYSTFVDGPERQYKVVQDILSLQAGVYGQYRWKFISLFGRVGLNYYQDSAELVDLHPLDEPQVVNPLSEWQDRNADSYYGLGFELHFDDEWSFSVQRDRIGLGDNDIKVWSGGFTFRF
ncbi:MAG: outer membrane beta-barrel protein [Acidobacteria bacterium]|nr:outer membrane beta-barrel protein [Acidobacteriota bacterium]MCB9397449.1 outer membrane beta-barrel protein [Acidobacteriota bacterium]